LKICNRCKKETSWTVASLIDKKQVCLGCAVDEERTPEFNIILRKLFRCKIVNGNQEKD